MTKEYILSKLKEHKGPLNSFIYDCCLEAKSLINKDLEILRKAGKVSKNSEVGIWIYSKYHAILKPIAENYLKEICRVSFSSCFPDEAEFRFEVKILKDLGWHECFRCQNWHMSSFNFKSETKPEQILCNYCTDLFISDFPNDEITPKILQNLVDRGLRPSDNPTRT